MKTLPFESSDGAAENVPPTSPSTNDVTAPANTSKQPTSTTVTEKSSESALKQFYP